MRCAAVALTAALALAPRMAPAQGLFDFLFGGTPQKQRQTNFFADPFGLNTPPTPPRPVASAGGAGPAFCVRTCDGRDFPVMARGGATPVPVCQAFCPASPTRVYFGSTIDGAASG